MYQNIYVDYKTRTVHIWDDKLGHIKNPLSKYRYAYLKDPRGRRKAIDGKTVRVVKKWSEVDERSGKLYEYDVPMETKALIHEYGDSDFPSTNHRELFFDIETEIIQGFPDWRDPVNKITAIAWYERSIDKYGVFILDEADRVKSVSKDNTEVVICKTESEMLYKFLEKYVELDPTIITGWNIEGFDIPYLYNRLKMVLGDDYANSLSPIGKVNYREHLDRYYIEGVSCLDYLPLYRKYTIGERSSYRLDAIGQTEVGLGKIEYEGTLDDLFEKDIDKYIEYNLNDVEIVKQLDDKLKFLDLTRTICHKGHVRYEYIHITSNYLEGAILTYCNRLGIVTKNKPENRKREGKFSGAYVKVPNPGRYDWIYDLDLTSLYPSIIMSLNISPETKVGKVLDWNQDAFIKNQERQFSVLIGKKQKKMMISEFRSFVEENNYAVSANGVMFDKSKPGLVPSILNKWFEERVEYKNLRKQYEKEGDNIKADFYDQKQYTQKILLNSMYGVLGLASFRFFDLDNAEAVTTTGQTVIKTTAKIGDQYYSKELGETKEHCIYTDTDSVFFSALPLVKKRYPHVDVYDDKAMSEKILIIAKDVQEHINTTYNVMAKKLFNINDHRFDIKQETIAKAGIWIAKKRYAQWIINVEGHTLDKLDVKGIDVVRSNFPAALRTFMAGVLQDILQNKTKDYIDNKVLDFREEIETLPILDVAKPTGVKNIEKYTLDYDGSSRTATKKGCPAHVKAAISYNDMITALKQTHLGEVREKEKIKWVYLKPNPYGYESMALKGYDDPQEIVEYVEKYIDYNKHFQSDLENKLLAFYTALGWGKLPAKNTKMIQKFFDFS